MVEQMSVSHFYQPLDYILWRKVIGGCLLFIELEMGCGLKLNKMCQNQIAQDVNQWFCNAVMTKEE